MAKFRIKWKEDVTQYWYNDVEADSAEEAELMFFNGEHVDGSEVLEEEAFIESDFLKVEIIDESEIDVIEDPETGQRSVSIKKKDNKNG